MAAVLKTLFHVVGSDIWLNNGYAKSPQCYVICTFTILLQYRIKFKKLDRKCYTDIKKGNKNGGAIECLKCFVVLLWFSFSNHSKLFTLGSVRFLNY